MENLEAFIMPFDHPDLNRNLIDWLLMDLATYLRIPDAQPRNRLKNCPADDGLKIAKVPDQPMTSVRKRKQNTTSII
jgi:hypothetical protein